MLVLRRHEQRLKHDATILQIEEIGIEARKYPLDDDMDKGVSMMQQSLRSIPKAETEDNSRFEPGGVGMMLKTPSQRQILMGNGRAT